MKSSNKLKETRSLYESEIHKVQKTPEKWKDFLDFAAKAQISKVQNEFEFSTKLIIHAINPKATDCRLFGEWKTQDGNHVNYGEHGITVLSRDSRGNQSVAYLFDTSQTALKKEPEPLEIPEEIKENLQSALSSMVEKYSNNASFSDEQKRIFKATAEYKLCKQYGLEPNDNAELFSGIEKLSVKEIANIGVSLNRCSQSFYEVVNNERRNFYETHRINDSQSRNDRTELYGRERRGVDLGGGSSDAHEEIRLQRGSERMEQAERGTGSVRADVLGTSAEADSSDGQVRQHETEIHMENSMSDRSNNAQRGSGSRGEPAEPSLRGTERESSESDRRDSGEEKEVGGIQGDRGIGAIPAEITNTGEIQGRSRGGNTPSDSIRNIMDETAETEMVSAVSFSEKVHAAFAEVAENHKYTAKQQQFLDRLEKFMVKHHVTENLIDEMSKHPAFQNEYGSRKNLSRSVFADRLGSLERELTDALQKQLAIKTVEEKADNHDKTAPTVDDLSVGDIILYDGKRREVEQIDENRISLKDLDAPDFGGILLGTSDVYAYAGWQEEMNNKGFEILSKAEKVSEITMDMYQTENPDIFVVKGKGSIAKIDISVSDELWDRLAEKGLVRNENSVDRLLYETDNINWNKLVIPDKWGNMTNNISIEDVLTREELLTAKSVADFVIKPEYSMDIEPEVEAANEIQWTPISETEDEKGRATSYSAKYNDKLYWISENANGRYDIETKVDDRIVTLGEEYSGFPIRDYAENVFEDYIADSFSTELETEITEPQNDPFSEEIISNNETIKYRITKNTDEQYKFNVQILTRSENGEFTYSGNGRFCETLDEAHAFIERDIADRNAKSTKEHLEKMKFQRKQYLNLIQRESSLNCLISAIIQSLTIMSLNSLLLTQRVAR